MADQNNEPAGHDGEERPPFGDRWAPPFGFGPFGSHGAHEHHGPHGGQGHGSRGAWGFGEHGVRGERPGRGRRGRPGFGFGPDGPPFPPPPPFGPPGGPHFGGPGWAGPDGPWNHLRQWMGYGGSRGPRARKGDVRAAALALLAEQPLNGYQIIQEIKQRSDGLWKPSSGSVYPALQQLEDEGLIVAGEHEGRRAFSLTDAGRAYVAENPEELAAPFEAVSADTSAMDAMLELRTTVGRTMGAFMQVCQAGDERQRQRALRVMEDARKALYRILAEDDERSEDDERDQRDQDSEGGEDDGGEGPGERA
ncbi:MAG TPA: PadR family transcriptional regulator [Pseudonocardiaceae bacterium]